MRRLFVLSVFFLLLIVTNWSQTVTIPVAKTVSSIPLLALEGRSFDGLKLKTPFFNDHSLALAELLVGKTQGLFTGSALAVQNSQTGGPLIQIATPVWDVSGLVTLNADLRTLKDFSGRILAVPLEGGPLDLQLRALLRSEDLAGKVRLEYAQPVQAALLLLNHRVDGACLPEPLVSRLVVMNDAKEVFTFAEAWAKINGGDGRAPQVSLLARRDWVARHRRFLVALTVALRQSAASVRADPQSYAQKFANLMGLSVPIVERGISRTLFDVPSRSDTVKLYASYLSRIGNTAPLPSDFFFQE